MTRRDWYDAPSTVSPLSAATLNDLEARKPEIATLPINLLEPPYNCQQSNGDPGAGIRAQNVTGLNLAIAQANLDRRLILAPPHELWFTTNATITTLDPAPGIIGTPGTVGSIWHFDKNGDCLVTKGLFKVFSGLYLNNHATSHSALDAVLRIKNCAYGTFENVYTATEGANSVGIMLEHEYTGSAFDAFLICHLGCWYNTFTNCQAVYTTSGVDTGYGLSYVVNSNAVSVVNPPGQTAGTYTGSVNHNTAIGLNIEGKLRGINLDRAAQNTFIGGQHIGSVDQIYGRNSSSENVFIGIRQTGWSSGNPFELDSSCRNTFVFAPILFKAGGGAPWSMGNTGTNPRVFATSEFVQVPELNLSAILGNEKHVIGFRGATGEVQLSTSSGAGAGRPRVNLGSSGATWIGKSSTDSFVEIPAGLEFPTAVASASVPNNTIFRDSADNVLKKKDNTGTVTAI